jgi:hypothetical protein
MKHLFLLFSIMLIAAYWAWLCTLYLLGVTIGSLTGAREIALHISAVTLVESTIIWLLLRGSGERPTHLGFGATELRLAFQNPEVLIAIGLLVLLNGVVGSLQALLVNGGMSATTVLVSGTHTKAPGVRRRRD